MMQVLFKYVFTSIIALCSFLITTSYNRVNANVLTLQAEVVQLKLQLVEINSKIINEQKVLKIVKN
jgi:hypothetical protein